MVTVVRVPDALGLAAIVEAPPVEDVKMAVEAARSLPHSPGYRRGPGAGTCG